jgi:opacity protein-like surface antigen
MGRESVKLAQLITFLFTQTYTSMKKQLLLLVLAMGLFSAVNAQSKLFGGLDLGFSSTSDVGSSFNIGPHIGYDLSERMALVVGVSFGSETDKTGAEDVKTSGFGVGAELRYGWSVGDKTTLYLAPGVGYASATNDATDIDVTSFNVGIAPGINYMIGDKWSLNGKFGNLGYESVTVGDADAVGTFGLDLTMSSMLFGLEYRF